MPVQFPLEPGKPPVIFRFNITSVGAMEEEGGGNPAHLAANGKLVTAMRLMLQYGRSHDDPTMNRRKAERLIDRYLDANDRDPMPLFNALIKALNESGVYGRPDADAMTPEEDGDLDPQTTTRSSPD